MSDQFTDDPRSESADAPLAAESVEDVVTDAQDAPVSAVDDDKKLTPEKLGEAALKFATETAYAAAGLADVIAERAKEFYAEQRKQLAEKTPEGVDPNFRQFVDTMPDQFKVILDDAVKAFHDLSERGRHTVTDLQSQVQHARAERQVHPQAFDLKEGADAGDGAEEAVAPEDVAFAEPVVAPEDAEAPVTDSYPGESKGEQRS